MESTMRDQGLSTLRFGWVIRCWSGTVGSLPKLAFFLVPGLFVMFCALLFLVWYVNNLSGWLILSFVLLIGAMLTVIFLLVLSMNMGASWNRLPLCVEGIDDCSGSLIGQSSCDGDTRLHADFGSVRTVDCEFRSGLAGGLHEWCDKTSCPWFRFSKESE